KNSNKDILAERNSLNEKLNNIIKELEEIRKEKVSFMDSYYFNQEKLKDINNEINEIEKSNNKLEVKEARYSVQWKNYNNGLLEEYEIGYEEGLKYKKEIGSLSKAKKEIRRLKNSIKELGAINLGAIEEFEKLKDRFSFMNNQRIDLVEGKEALKDVIREMEEKMEEQFIISFKEIRNNFSKVFVELFGGGKGDIYLEDESSPLFSGIEIVAQPPGKKPQNLSLL